MKKLHFAWFGSSGHGGDADSWTRTTPGYDWRTPELYRDTALACERAGFDFIFFADTLALPEVYQGKRDHYLRHGMYAPVHDPIAILALLAGLTSKIGLVSTISTSFYPPFMAARMLSTIDHLSRGRVGVNLVTSAQKAAAQNFGADDLLDHDDRYDVADEYIALCRKLWDSWERDALVMDRATGLFADPAKVHDVDFEGRFFRCKGPGLVSSSPQHHPVVISAGSSPRGMRFAAEHAEVTVIAKNNVADMTAFAGRFREQLVTAGRAADACRIFTLFRPVIGETEAIAREKNEALKARLSWESGLANLSEQMGVDLSRFDPDRPLPRDMKINALQSRYDDYYAQNTPTLRQIALVSAQNAGFPVCGTPEQIADILENTAREAGIDGFFLRLPIEDHALLVEFVDKVIPILQERGVARTSYDGRHLRDHLNG